MSWNGLAANQCVSASNLNDGVNNGDFEYIAGSTSGNQLLTRADIESLVRIDTNLLDSNGVANNQLVVKSDLSGFVEIQVANTSAGITIGTLTVNGSTPAGLTLPISYGGNYGTGKIYFFGLVNIAVTWSADVQPEHVTLIDSNSNVYCDPENAYAVIYPGVACNGNNPITLTASAGTCS